MAMNERMPVKPDMITILGHTAGGKTSLAASVAHLFGGEVISADSRQVYRGMTIGTGKDYGDYVVEGQKVPYHLIDILDAGEAYSVHTFQKDFFSAYGKLKKRGVLSVLCGGTGLYIESVLRQYDMLHVPVNEARRRELEALDLEELTAILDRYRRLHNTTDTLSKKRAIRAIEIAEYEKKEQSRESSFPVIRSVNVGIRYERDVRRSRITDRLKQRLDEGMIGEAEALLKAGVDHEKLEYYGLEYKFLSQYLRGALSREEMFSGLNSAIHRFAKRQMTYFRGMERRGVKIHWLDGSLPFMEKVERIRYLYDSTT